MTLLKTFMVSMTVLLFVSLFIPHSFAIRQEEGLFAAASVIVRADADKSEVVGAEIDLTNETITLPSGFRCVAYSTDDGVKWKKGDTFDLSKFLDKGGVLRISNRYDIKTKSAYDGKMIVFPKIEARPKANAQKLTVNYAVYADRTGATDGAWVLAEKNSDEPIIEGVEVSLNQTKWFAMPEEGIGVKKRFIMYAHRRPAKTESTYRRQSLLR